MTWKVIKVVPLPHCQRCVADVLVHAGNVNDNFAEALDLLPNIKTLQFLHYREDLYISEGRSWTQFPPPIVFPNSVSGLPSAMCHVRSITLNRPDMKIRIDFDVVLRLMFLPSVEKLEVQYLLSHDLEYLPEAELKDAFGTLPLKELLL